MQVPEQSEGEGKQQQKLKILVLGFQEQEEDHFSFMYLSAVLVLRSVVVFGDPRSIALPYYATAASVICPFYVDHEVLFAYTLRFLLLS